MWTSLAKSCKDSFGNCCWNFVLYTECNRVIKAASSWSMIYKWLTPCITSRFCKVKTVKSLIRRTVVYHIRRILLSWVVHDRAVGMLGAWYWKQKDKHKWLLKESWNPRHNTNFRSQLRLCSPGSFYVPRYYWDFRIVFFRLFVICRVPS